MNQTTRKHALINMAIMAQSDGALDPLEKDFIKDFMNRAGISASQANQWLTEARENGWEFQPIEDHAEARDVLKLMIGMAGADKKLAQKETPMLAAMAKACNLSHEDLSEFIREHWQSAVLDDLFAEGMQEEAQSKAPTFTIIEDDFPELDAFIERHPDVHFECTSLERALKNPPSGDYILLHAHEDKRQSLLKVQKLKSADPNKKMVAVVPRHSAFQISYLIEEGIDRCLVPPIFQNELLKFIRRS